MRDDRQADAGSSQVGRPASPRQLADLLLGEPGLVERTAHAELARRLPARTVVAAIIGVAAVGNHGDAALGANAGQRRVQLVLAVVAAVGRIGPVLGAIELRCVNDLVAQAELTRDPQRELTMMIGIAGAVGGDAERGWTEHRGGFPRQIRAVGAAAEGDQQRLGAGEHVSKDARLFALH